MKRRMIFSIMIATLAATVFGSAASLGIGARDLAAGDAVVAECDPNGFGHDFPTTSGGKVTEVTVTGIDDACVGGQLSLTITDSSGADIGSGGTVTVNGASANVTSISPQPSAPDVAGIHIVVVGP